MGTGKLLGKPNKLPGNDLLWTSILSRGSRNTPSRFMLQKPGISSGSYGPLGSKGFIFVIGCTCLRSISLVMLSMKKELHGFLFLDMHMCFLPFVMVLCLAAQKFPNMFVVFLEKSMNIFTCVTKEKSN